MKERKYEKNGGVIEGDFFQKTQKRKAPFPYAYENGTIEGFLLRLREGRPDIRLERLPKGGLGGQGKGGAQDRPKQRGSSSWRGDRMKHGAGSAGVLVVSGRQTKNRSLGRKSYLTRAQVSESKIPMNEGKVPSRKMEILPEEPK